MDTTGMNNLRNLWKRSEKEGIRIILSGVTDKVYQSLDRIGLADEIGKEYIFPHIVPALAKAQEICKQ